MALYNVAVALPENGMVFIQKAKAALVITLLAILMADCGGDGANAPKPDVPWAGSAGTVLIGENADSDHIPDQLWVGFNDPNVWQQFKALRAVHGNDGSFWIGGHVVVSTTSSVGFYFDPATTRVGEITAEGQQTTLDFIKTDPSTFANTGFGNPIIWYVPAVIQQVSGP